MILGITGGIGSGKSMVAQLFCEQGFLAIDADRIGHRILENDEQVKTEVEKMLGTSNRAALRNLVFINMPKRKQLESIMWPAIRKEIETEIRNKKGRDIIIEAALLIESGFTDLVDTTIMVNADRKTRVRRLKAVGRYDTSTENIIKAQLPILKKHADFIIENAKNPVSTKQQVARIIEQLRCEHG